MASSQHGAAGPEEPGRAPDAAPRGSGEAPVAPEADDSAGRPVAPGEPPVAPDPELMAHRYGRRPTGRRGRAIAVSLGVLAAIAFVAWQVIGLTSDNVTTEHVAVEVVDPARIDVTINVITDPGTTVSCTLRAVSSNFTEVGVHEETIGPVTEQVTTVTVPISTVERAASGEVVGCDIVED